MNQLDLLAYDMVNTFLVDFSELITYIPYKGQPIQITALIKRKPPTALRGLDGATVYQHEIRIANDPTAGVTVINEGNDKVILSNKVGGDDETFIVSQIIKNDLGSWLLGVG